MLQLPPLDPSTGEASDAGNTPNERDPWLADKPSQFARTKAIEFHCPTLVTTSYDQKGLNIIHVARTGVARAGPRTRSP